MNDRWSPGFTCILIICLLLNSLRLCWSCMVQELAQLRFWHLEGSSTRPFWHSTSTSEPHAKHLNLAVLSSNMLSSVCRSMMLAALNAMSTTSELQVSRRNYAGIAMLQRACSDRRNGLEMDWDASHHASDTLSARVMTSAYARGMCNEVQPEHLRSGMTLEARVTMPLTATSLPMSEGSRSRMTRFSLTL